MPQSKNQFDEIYWRFQLISSRYVPGIIELKNIISYVKKLYQMLHFKTNADEIRVREEIELRWQSWQRVSSTMERSWV